ncbi:MAG: hypothetical protein L0Z53_17940, partial [Acidobacteriales bacterium]|nr:hypothetical protein [Terriglobales bacterium]
MSIAGQQQFVFSAPTPLVETYDTGVGFNPMLARVLPGMVGIAEHSGTTLPDGRIVILGGKNTTNVANGFRVAAERRGNDHIAEVRIASLQTPA